MAFLDLFSDGSAVYAAARPRYPRALFEFVAAIAPAHALAWDCATGNGQAAVDLARYFAHVEATDASAAQIAQALPQQGVRYSVQPAERTDLAPCSVDTVTVAQALHWFDHAAFYREVRRVLRPGGAVVAWGYSWFRIEPEFDRVFADAMLGPIRNDWAAQARLLWDGYRDLPFPFRCIAPPSLALELDWDFTRLLAFVHSWSATRRCIEREGRGFFDAAETRLAPLWGEVQRTRRVTMPICILAGTHDAA